MNKKIIIAAIFIFLLNISTVLFWRQPFLLFCVFIVLAFIKHLLSPIKRELLYFVLAGILGTGSECLVMYIGGNPWNYNNTTILNFPIYALSLWGFAAISFLTLAQGLSEKK